MVKEMGLEKGRKVRKGKREMGRGNKRRRGWARRRNKGKKK